MPGAQLPKVPEGLRDLMKSLTKEILREKPTNIYEFSAQFFERMIEKQKDFTVKEFEPISEYDFIKSRERTAIPVALLYTIMPAELTSLVKNFIKAVLRNRPENICVFGVEYFRRLQNLNDNKCGHIDYMTFESYFRGKEKFAFTPYVKCTCGRTLGADMTFYNNSKNVEIVGKVSQPSNGLSGFCNMPSCEKLKELDLKENATKRINDLLYDERTLKAIFIIQKFFRQLIIKKRATSSLKQIRSELSLPSDRSNDEIATTEGHKEILDKNNSKKVLCDDVELKSPGTHISEAGSHFERNLYKPLSTEKRIEFNASELILEDQNSIKNTKDIGEEKRETTNHNLNDNDHGSEKLFETITLENESPLLIEDISSSAKTELNPESQDLENKMHLKSDSKLYEEKKLSRENENIPSSGGIQASGKNIISNSNTSADMSIIEKSSITSETDDITTKISSVLKTVNKNQHLTESMEETEIVSKRNLLTDEKEVSYKDGEMNQTHTTNPLNELPNISQSDFKTQIFVESEAISNEKQKISAILEHRIEDAETEINAELNKMELERNSLESMNENDKVNKDSSLNLLKNNQHSELLGENSHNEILALKDSEENDDKKIYEVLKFESHNIKAEDEIIASNNAEISVNQELEKDFTNKQSDTENTAGTEDIEGIGENASDNNSITIQDFGMKRNEEQLQETYSQTYSENDKTCEQSQSDVGDIKALDETSFQTHLNGEAFEQSQSHKGDENPSHKTNSITCLENDKAYDDNQSNVFAEDVRTDKEIDLEEELLMKPYDSEECGKSEIDTFTISSKDIKDKEVHETKEIQETPVDKHDQFEEHQSKIELQNVPQQLKELEETESAKTEILDIENNKENKKTLMQDVNVQLETETKDSENSDIEDEHKTKQNNQSFESLISTGHTIVSQLENPDMAGSANVQDKEQKTSSVYQETDGFENNKEYDTNVKQSAPQSITISENVQKYEENSIHIVTPTIFDGPELQIDKESIENISNPTNKENMDSLENGETTGGSKTENPEDVDSDLNAIKEQTEQVDLTQQLELEHIDEPEHNKALGDSIDKTSLSTIETKGEIELSKISGQQTEVEVINDEQNIQILDSPSKAQDQTVEIEAVCPISSCSNSNERDNLYEKNSELSSPDEVKNCEHDEVNRETNPILNVSKQFESEHFTDSKMNQALEGSCAEISSIKSEMDGENKQNINLSKNSPNHDSTASGSETNKELNEESIIEIELENSKDEITLVDKSNVILVKSHQEPEKNIEEVSENILTLEEDTISKGNRKCNNTQPYIQENDKIETENTDGLFKNNLIKKTNPENDDSPDTLKRFENDHEIQLEPLKREMQMQNQKAIEPSELHTLQKAIQDPEEKINLTDANNEIDYSKISFSHVPEETTASIERSLSSQAFEKESFEDEENFKNIQNETQNNSEISILSTQDDYKKEMSVNENEENQTINIPSEIEVGDKLNDSKYSIEIKQENEVASVLNLQDLHQSLHDHNQIDIDPSFENNSLELSNKQESAEIASNVPTTSSNGTGDIKQISSIDLSEKSDIKSSEKILTSIVPIDDNPQAPILIELEDKESINSHLPVEEFPMSSANQDCINIKNIVEPSSEQQSELVSVSESANNKAEQEDKYSIGKEEDTTETGNFSKVEDPNADNSSRNSSSVLVIGNQTAPKTRKNYKSDVNETISKHNGKQKRNEEDNRNVENKTLSIQNGGVTKEKLTRRESEEKQMRLPIAEIYLKSFKLPDNGNTSSNSFGIPNSTIQATDNVRDYIMNSTINQNENICQESDGTEYSDSLNEDKFERDSLEIGSSKDTDMEEDSLETDHSHNLSGILMPYTDTERTPTYLYGIHTPRESPIPARKNQPKAIAYVIPFENENPKNKILNRSTEKSENTQLYQNNESEDQDEEEVNFEKAVSEILLDTNDVIVDSVNEKDNEDESSGECRLHTIFEQNETESPRQFNEQYPFNKECIDSSKPRNIFSPKRETYLPSNQNQNQITEFNDLKHVENDIFNDKNIPTNIVEFERTSPIKTFNYEDSENGLQKLSHESKKTSQIDDMDLLSQKPQDELIESNDALSSFSDHDLSDSSTYTTSREFDDSALLDEPLTIRNNYEGEHFPSSVHEKPLENEDGILRGGIYEIDINTLNEVSESNICGSYRKMEAHVDQNIQVPQDKIESGEEKELLEITKPHIEIADHSVEESIDNSNEENTENEYKNNLLKRNEPEKLGSQNNTPQSSIGEITKSMNENTTIQEIETIETKLLKSQILLSKFEDQIEKDKEETVSLLEEPVQKELSKSTIYELNPLQNEKSKSEETQELSDRSTIPLTEGNNNSNNNLQKSSDVDELILSQQSVDEEINSRTDSITDTGLQKELQVMEKANILCSHEIVTSNGETSANILQPDLGIELVLHQKFSNEESLDNKDFNREAKILTTEFVIGVGEENKEEVAVLNSEFKDDDVMSTFVNDPIQELEKESLSLSNMTDMKTQQHEDDSSEGRKVNQNLLKKETCPQETELIQSEDIPIENWTSNESYTDLNLKDISLPILKILNDEPMMNNKREESIAEEKMQINDKKKFGNLDSENNPTSVNNENIHHDAIDLSGLTRPNLEENNSQLDKEITFSEESYCLNKPKETKEDLQNSNHFSEMEALNMSSKQNENVEMRAIASHLDKVHNLEEMIFGKVKSTTTTELETNQISNIQFDYKVEDPTTFAVSQEYRVLSPKEKSSVLLDKEIEEPIGKEIINEITNSIKRNNQDSGTSFSSIAANQVPPMNPSNNAQVVAEKTSAYKTETASEQISKVENPASTNDQTIEESPSVTRNLGIQEDLNDYSIDIETEAKSLQKLLENTKSNRLSNGGPKVLAQSSENYGYSSSTVNEEEKSSDSGILDFGKHDISILNSYEGPKNLETNLRTEKGNLKEVQKNSKSIQLISGPSNGLNENFQKGTSSFHENNEHWKDDAKMDSVTSQKNQTESKRNWTNNLSSFENAAIVIQKAFRFYNSRCKTNNQNFAYSKKQSISPNQSKLIQKRVILSTDKGLEREEDMNLEISSIKNGNKLSWFVGNEPISCNVDTNKDGSNSHHIISNKNSNKISDMTQALVDSTNSGFETNDVDNSASVDKDNSFTNQSNEEKMVSANEANGESRDDLGKTCDPEEGYIAEKNLPDVIFSRSEIPQLKGDQEISDEKPQKLKYVSNNKKNIKQTEEFLKYEIHYNTVTVLTEVLEKPCVKRCVSATKTYGESSDKETPSIDNEDNRIDNSTESNIASVEKILQKPEEAILKMQQRRSSETKVFENDESCANQPSFDEPVIITMETIVDTRNSSTEGSDDVIIVNTLDKNFSQETEGSILNSHMKESGSGSEIFEVTNTSLKRLHTIAGGDLKTILKSVTINDTIKYVEMTESDVTTTSGGSLSLDEDTSENIRKKIMAYSLSEADSDSMDPRLQMMRNMSFDHLQDDFNINTVLEDTESTSTETESTIISAATKIQAGARGFLVRRKLRRASADAKSPGQYDTKDSFGNNAISESLETLIENEAAKKIQKAYRKHRRQQYNFGSSVPVTNVENSLAAKRLTFQRGDALRNNSSPEDENTNIEISKSNGDTKLDHTATTTQKQNSSDKIYKTNKTVVTSGTRKINENELKWLAIRQNSMPVQIDSQIFRVIPKHTRMRKKVSSAEFTKKRCQD